MTRDECTPLGLVNIIVLCNENLVRERSLAAINDPLQHTKVTACDGYSNLLGYNTHFTT